MTRRLRSNNIYALSLSPMKAHYLLLLYCTTLFWACNLSNQAATESTVTLPANEEAFTIAFGSCNHQDKPQPIWKDIKAEQPDLWIWLGDNIYADTDDMAVLQKKYDKQNATKEYADFKNDLEMIGVWDDHDYGVNDGDGTFSAKHGSRDLALDFLGVPADAEVRSREGMYQSYSYTYEGMVVRVILLDGRYFREPIKRIDKVYQADPDGDILGAAQWSWLEQELAKEEDLLIIGTGVQIIPDEHRFEKWALFPTSQKRLFSLLEKETTENIVLLSGDRHIGEVSKLPLSSKVVYEVTSSGLTHGYRGVNKETNRYRIGTLTQKLNYGLIQISKDRSIELKLCEQGRRRHVEVEL